MPAKKKAKGRKKAVKKVIKKTVKKTAVKTAKTAAVKQKPLKVKAGKGGIIPPVAHRFSSSNQPSPEAKSEGIKKWYDRQRMLDLVAEKFAEEIPLGDGTKIAGTEALVLRLKRTLLSPKADKLTIEQAKLAFKFFDIMSKPAHNAEEKPENSEPQKGSKGKVDFITFCLNAFYPKPFRKQIEMKDFALQGGANMLLGSRGYGKTDYISICGVAYAIYLDPLFTCLLVTKEKSRGADICLEVANVLEANGVLLSRKSSKQVRVEGLIGKDANLTALPVRSKGFRGKHPKFILCDDIITPDDDSKAERVRVEKVVDELFKLTPNITLLGQPVHSKDVYAKFRRQKGVKKLEVPYGSIPELDTDLEAQRAAGVSERSIQASYFLKIEDMDRIPFAKVQFADFFPQGTCAGFIDPSHEGNDYTAFAMCAANFDQLIFAGFAWQKAWDDCLEDIAEVMRAFNCVKFAFETNGVGKHPIMVLRQMGANVKGWKSTSNKHARIMNAAMYRDNIRLCNTLPPALNKPYFREAQKAFNDMVIEYEYKAEHDDAPDALANLMMYIGKITDEHKGNI